ncbi:MAG: methyltransferase domain-containing protein [Chloroflexi bacterium]|nr:methyltransferase domain-containing protein [Chloroflexota bacterium]
MDESNGDDTVLDWAGAPSDFQAYGPGFLARTYLVDRALRRLRPDRLLDIGCGRGNVTVIAARHARQVIATDVAQDAVAATTALLATHAGAQAFVADNIAGDWGDVPNDQRRPFGCVLLSEVLEHLDDDVAALETCRELLTDNGCLLITVPANPALWTRWDDLAGHRRRYTKQELVSKLETAGFRVLQITSWGFPLTGWLARRGARMRSRRLDEEHAGGEVPAALRRILPLASIAFKIAARVEPLLSFLDRGDGYVVLAQRDPVTR